MSDNYYGYRKTDFGWVARIYKFDETGNKEVKVWESYRNYNSPEEATDAAVDYAEENGIEVELG